MNLFTGNLNGTSNLTIGDGTAVFFVVQIGVTGNTNTSGSLTAAPVFNIGSGALQLIYAPEATARTTGFEIPATRIVDAVSISNPEGVVLAGGNLLVNASGVSTGSLTLSSGVLTTSAGNVLTLGTAAATIPTGSATSYVKGPLGITVNSATAVSRTFAVGDAAGWRPVVVGGITTSSNQVFTATVISGATGGTVAGGLSSLNPTRYVRLQNTANLPATATVQLSYGADDVVGAPATAVVAQAATANGAYASLGGAAATTPTTGIASTQSLTPGSDYFVLANTEGGTLASSVAAVCAGTNSGTLTLSGNTGTITGYQADTGSGFVTLAGTNTGSTYTFTNLTATTTFRAVILTSDNRTVYSTPVTVTVNPATTATFSYAGGTYCVSGTNPAPTVTGTAGGTFASTTGLTIDANTGAITLSTSTPSTYTVTYSVGGSCPSSATAQVTITSAPVATFSYANPAYCAGGTNPAPVFAAGASGGTFTSTTGLVINASTGVIDLSASTAGPYTVTNAIAASGGCAAVSATTTVVVNALPTATLAAGSATTFCAGGSVVLTAPAGTGNTYQFFNGTTSLGAASATNTFTATAAGSYTVVVTSASGCTATSTATAVTVNPATTATFSYAGGTYCASGATNPTATVTGTAGGTFASTTGLSINATTGAINLAGSTPSTYTVTYSVGGSCPSSATAAVTITAAPVATFSYGTASTYCVSGTTAPAVVLGTGATAGTFSSTTGLTLDASTGAITLSSSTPSTYTVTNAVAAANGCAATTATTQVTITAAPTAAFSYATATGCVGSTGTAAPTLGTGATAGTFSSTTGLTINATTGTITLSSSTAGTYTVTNTVAAASGCAAATAMATFTVNPRPATPAISAAYGSTSTSLTSSATTGNQFYFNNVAIAGATAQTYVVNGTPASLGSYTVTTTNANGCISLPSVPLVVTSSLKPLAGSSLMVYPNPTHDGNLTVELKGYHKLVELTVLNALGQVVRTALVPASTGNTTQGLDLSQLPSGIYIMRAKTEGGIDARRIVKE